MAHQDDPTALVVVVQVIGPRIQHVVVADPAYGRIVCARHRLSGLSGAERREGELAVERGEEPAFGAQPGELHLHDVDFFGAGDHVADHARIVRDRRIDVEAVDRRLGIGLERLKRFRSVRLHNGGRKVDGAGIVLGLVGPAEPGVRLGVVVPGRRGRLGAGVRRTQHQARADQRSQHHPGHRLTPGVGLDCSLRGGLRGMGALSS